MSKSARKIIKLSEAEKKDPPTFRGNNGFSTDVHQRLSDKGKEYGIKEIISMPTDQIVLAEWVNLKCRYGCSQFNTNWCCPPATPDLTQSRNIIAEYSIALLLEGEQQCTNFYVNNSKKRAEQVRFWKGPLILERQLFLEGYDKAFSLVSGACALCKKCFYPKKCKFPTERRPTVESLAIDLIGTLKNVGKSTPVALDTKECFNYYAIILLD